MDMFTLRAAERILALLIGGFTIFLGYKLFMHLPEKTNSEGKIILPGNISVYLSRVGPGVFFAVFGTIVVAASFYFQFKVINPVKNVDENQSEMSPSSITYSIAASGGTEAKALESARSSMLSYSRLLNKISEKLEKLPASDKGLDENLKNDFLLAIPQLKLALVASVWGKDWGDYPGFAAWAQKGAVDPVPKGSEQAAKYFNGM